MFKIGLPTLLTLLFMTLKLSNHITWSWFWVLSPAIFAAGLGVLVTIAAFLIIFWLRNTSGS